jgi:hypothetical protein
MKFHHLLDTEKLKAPYIQTYLEKAATFLDKDQKIISQPLLKGVVLLSLQRND